MRHRRCIVIEITLIYVVSGNSGWCGCFHRKGASLPRHDNPKLFLSIFYAFHGAKRHESRDQHCTNHEGVQQDGGDNPWSWICYPSLSLYLVLTLHHFSTIFQSTWAKTQKKPRVNRADQEFVHFRGATMLSRRPKTLWANPQITSETEVRNKTPNCWKKILSENMRPVNSNRSNACIRPLQKNIRCHIWSSALQNLKIHQGFQDSQIGLPSFSCLKMLGTWWGLLRRSHLQS